MLSMYWLVSCIPISRILMLGVVDNKTPRPVRPKSLMPPAGPVVNSPRAITCPIHDVWRLEHLVWAGVSGHRDRLHFGQGGQRQLAGAQGLSVLQGVLLIGYGELPICQGEEVPLDNACLRVGDIQGLLTESPSLPTSALVLLLLRHLLYF